MRALARTSFVVALGCLATAAPVVAAMRSGFVDITLDERSSERLEGLARDQRYVEAFDRAVQELRLAVRRFGAEDDAAVLALHRVGTIAHLAGDQATAEEVLGAALGARRRHLPAEHPAIVETLLRRGRAARFRGDRARARAHYDEAEALLARRPGSFPALEGELLQLRADWVRGEDEASSISLYRRALALRRATFTTPSFAVADNETWLAWTLAHTGRHAEARPHVDEAVRQLDALGLPQHSLRATLDQLLAEALVLEGRPGDAERHYRDAAKRCAAVRRSQAGGYPRRGFPLDSYDALALAALRRGEGDEAWRLLETGRAATHADFSALGLWSRIDPTGFERWSADRRTLDRARKQLEALSGGPPIWETRTAPAFVETLAARARVSRSAQAYLAAHRPSVPSLDRVRGILRERDALVGWLELRIGGTPSDSYGPDRSEAYAFVVRSSGPVAWVPLWTNRSADEHRALRMEWGPVFAVLHRAASWPARVVADPEVDVWMRAWARRNVDPILPHLEGVDRLVLERLIEPVELAVLPDGRRVGDAFDVSYVPSALTLVLLDDLASRAPRAHLGDSILAVAGPTRPGPESRVDQLIGAADAPSAHRGGRSAYRRDETPLASLPPLRYADLEARSVASLFDRSLVLEGNDASNAIGELARRDRLAGFRVLHVATHTLTDGAPERCALALSDGSRRGPAGGAGMLEVEDIVLGWRLDAELITLSGCETLRAAGAGRGEPFGFTPALLSAGARRVLSSLWPVDDRATTILMNRFYENYTGRYTDRRFGTNGAPMRSSRALREARTYVRTLTDAAGRRPYEHPVYWAGFFLVGLPD